MYLYVGNIVPKVGFKLTALAFQASVLLPHRLPDVTTMPTPTCLCASEVSADYYTRYPGIVSLVMLTIVYI